MAPSTGSVSTRAFDLAGTRPLAPGAAPPRPRSPASGMGVGWRPRPSLLSQALAPACQRIPEVPPLSPVGGTKPWQVPSKWTYALCRKSFLFTFPTPTRLLRTREQNNRRRARTHAHTCTRTRVHTRAHTCTRTHSNGGR